MPPAARIFDPVVHPLPPVLQPGPGSFNVIIGFLQAWRAIPTAAAAGLQAAKAASDIAIKAAEAATLAAAGTPGAPAAKLAEETLKAQQAAQMSATITSMAGGADIHMCATPLPIPPHGPGVVVDGSPTVLINGLPASRMGDTIIEAIGPPNKIAMGCPTVMIGNSGGGGGGGGGAGGSGGGGGAGGSGGGGGAGGSGGSGGSGGGGGGGGAGGSGGPGGGGGGGGAGAGGGANPGGMQNASAAGRPFCEP